MPSERPVAPAQGYSRSNEIITSRVLVAWNDDEAQFEEGSPPGNVKQFHLGGLLDQEGVISGDASELALFIGNNKDDNTMLFNLHLPIMSTNSVETPYDVYIVLPVEKLRMNSTRMHVSDRGIPVVLRERYEASSVTSRSRFAEEFLLRIRFTLTKGTIALHPDFPRGHSLSLEPTQPRMLTALQSLAETEELDIFLPFADSTNTLLRDVGMDLCCRNMHTPELDLKPATAEGRAWKVNGWRKFLKRIKRFAAESSTSTMPAADIARPSHSRSPFESSSGGGSRIPPPRSIWNSFASFGNGSAYPVVRNNLTSTAHGDLSGNQYTARSGRKWAAGTEYELFNMGNAERMYGSALRNRFNNPSPAQGMYGPGSLFGSDATSQPAIPYGRPVTRSMTQSEESLEGLSVRQDPTMFMGMPLAQMQRQRQVQAGRNMPAAPALQQTTTAISPSFAVGNNLNFTFRAQTLNSSENYNDTCSPSSYAHAAVPASAPVAARASAPATARSSVLNRNSSSNTVRNTRSSRRQLFRPLQPVEEQQLNENTEDDHQYDEAAIVRHARPIYVSRDFGSSVRAGRVVTNDVLLRHAQSESDLEDPSPKKRSKS